MYYNDVVNEQERFWAKVDKTPTCWLWTGAKTGGYGVFGHPQRRSHRLSYEWLVGPIPEGLQMDHLCRVRACVNPDHLEPVTQQVNLLRGETIVAARAAQTSCVRGHPFDEDNTLIVKNGRMCKACLAMRARQRTRALRDQELSSRGTPLQRRRKLAA